MAKPKPRSEIDPRARLVDPRKEGKARLHFWVDEERRRPLNNLMLVAIVEALKTHPSLPRSQVYQACLRRLQYILHDHLGGLRQDYLSALDHADILKTLDRAAALDKLPRPEPDPDFVDEMNKIRDLDNLPRLQREEYQIDDRHLLDPLERPLFNETHPPRKH